jgi:hypothetical protein
MPHEDPWFRINAVNMDRRHQHVQQIERSIMAAPSTRQRDGAQQVWIRYFGEVLKLHIFVMHVLGWIVKIFCLDLHRMRLSYQNFTNWSPHNMMSVTDIEA